jgi:DNA-binding FadR family transcriptional regulator
MSGDQVDPTTLPDTTLSAGLSPIDRRLMFGSLPMPDMTTAVQRRIRAAIGLGYFADGERLPREADLAQSLGVTIFALREALSVLRDEGLIVTRAGRNGGSFVRSRQESRSLAVAELKGLSATELRDLGDWRHMLASVSAYLAAQRASESNRARLREYATQVGVATSPIEARRAHGRFHVELAAAAQSIRMSKAQFAMQEEFDWLFGLVLDDPRERQERSQSLLAIVEALDRRQPEAARSAADRHSVVTVQGLARLRLECIATDRMLSVEVSGLTLASELAQLTQDLLTTLTRLAKSCGPLLAKPTDGSELRARVASGVLASLGDIRFAVHGMGVLADVGIVDGHPYWVDWWQRTQDGPLHDVNHVIDPSREDFYNYVDSEYMSYPREHRVPWAAGPYVDYGGVNDYTLTVTVPIVARGRFLGVAAADLLVADIEKQLAPWLAAIGVPCLFLNAEDRVVAANSVGHMVGDVVQSTTGYEEHPVGRFGWKILTKT